MSDNISTDVLAQQHTIMEKLADITQKLANSRRKDGWDKLSALSAALSVVAIGLVGGIFTYVYKSREIHIAEAQVVEKFLPHLVGTNETAKNGAIMAIATLGNTELATRLGVSFASAGTIDALEYLLKTARHGSKALVRPALVRAYAIRARDIIDNNKDLDQALKDYARIHALEPGDQLKKNYDNTFLFDLYDSRADVYYMQLKYDLAVDDYKRAVQFSPSEYYKAHSIAKVANTYAAQGNFDEARRTFDLAFKNATPAAGMYRMRGLFYIEQEDFVRAIEDLKQALALKIDEGYAFYNLMYAYAKKDDSQNAAREFIKVRNRVTEPKLQERLDKDFEGASRKAGNATFIEKVKQEMEAMKLKEQPTSGKAEAKP
jgi:tetratricopeptide (TPR) repeat protein